MANSGNQDLGSINDETNCKIWHQKNTSFIHCTDEQNLVFEAIYAQCPNPSLSQRLEMKCMFPILSSMDDKDIKDWFKNKRECEEVKKGRCEVESIKEKLGTTNKLLKNENEKLMKRISELISENDFLKQKLHDVSSSSS